MSEGEKMPEDATAELSPYERFRKLASTVVSVPKRDIDKQEAPAVRTAGATHVNSSVGRQKSKLE